MKIGVVIPCYYGHVNKLFQLLESINSQTIFPNKVVVSSSSTDELVIDKQYKFDLEIVATTENLNAAKNRNKASSKLSDMDYITFIDADDIMHPQRIEILLHTIKHYDSDIILHNFQIEPFNKEQLFENFDEIKVRTNTLIQCWSGCIKHIDGYDVNIDKIHHSQVTVKNWILNVVQFPEEVEFNKREDCVFCHRVFSIPDIKHAYVQNKLSYYNPSGTGGIS
jgi:glycosyltransferase involved in cell wall biosynthesis